MKDLPEYELLSAYLDGELTARERARVEQLLAGDPAARQQLDELRALSNTLHALPVNRVNEDLSARVLRQAERRMLSGSPVAVTQAAAEPPPEPIAEPSIGQRLKQPRIWFWPAVALAVALLMWLRGPEVEPPAGPQVAMAPKAAPPAEAPSIQASRKMVEAAPALSAESSDAVPPPPAAPGFAADRPMAEAMPTAAPAQEMARPEGRARELKMAEKQEAAPGAMASEPAASRGASHLATKAIPADREREVLSPSRSAGQEAPMAMKAKGAEAAQAGQPPLVIVQCEITREAARQQVVQELLATDLSRQVSGNRLFKGGTDLKKDFDTDQLQGRRPLTQSPDGSFIEFSATRDELLALLAKLKARPDLFASVSEPTPLGLQALDKANAAPVDGFGVGQETNGQYSRQQQPVVKMRQEAKSSAVNKPQGGQSLNASKLEDEAVRQMPQSQPIAQQQMETPQDKQARRDRGLSDELSYRVRIELRVVADAPMAGEPAQPAAAAQPGRVPVAPPAKAKQ